VLHCSFAHDMWSFAFSAFGVHWGLPKRVIMCTLAGKGFMGGIGTASFDATPHCLMLIMWRKRKN
jgi:hypothetical protein